MTERNYKERWSEKTYFVICGGLKFMIHKGYKKKGREPRPPPATQPPHDAAAAPATTILYLAS